MEPQIAPRLDRLLRRAEIACAEGERTSARRMSSPGVPSGTSLSSSSTTRAAKALEDVCPMVPGAARERRADDEVGLGRSVAIEQADARQFGELRIRKWPGTRGQGDARVSCRRSSGCGSRDSRIGTIAPRRYVTVAFRSARVVQNAGRRIGFEARRGPGQHRLKEGVQGIGVKQRQGRAQQYRSRRLPASERY